MRLSLRRTAHVYVAGTAKQEIRVRSGRDDEGKVGIARFRLQATDTTGAMATASQTVATFPQLARPKNRISRATHGRANLRNLTSQAVISLEEPSQQQTGGATSPERAFARAALWTALNR
jgi:hypothetical protein